MYSTADDRLSFVREKKQTVAILIRSRQPDLRLSRLRLFLLTRSLNQDTDDRRNRDFVLFFPSSLTTEKFEPENVVFQNYV